MMNGMPRIRWGSIRPIAVIVTTIQSPCIPLRALNAIFTAGMTGGWIASCRDGRPVGGLSSAVSQKLLAEIRG